MQTPAYLDDELKKAKSIIEANPDIERIELMIPDINATLRGKWLPVRSLESIYKQGVRLPGSVFALDMWGAEVHSSGMITENGDPDAVCLPSKNGFQLGSRTQSPSAQLLASVYNINGSPFFADPSHVLASVVDRFAELGLKPVVALEIEFHLFKKDKDPHQQIQNSHSEVYSLRELERHRDLLDEIESVCKIQAIPSDTIIAEAGANQFEINLQHIDDARQACEHAVLLKRIIKSLANRHGMIASFMAKPFANDAGNGMHTNISLADEYGKNAFAGENGEPLLKYALAGLLETMVESTLLFAPHANSYRRFQPGAHAPTMVSWGIDNRNMSIRLPKNANESMRIEHRVAGADANPFLVLAGILAAMHHGISHKLSPPAADESVPEPGPLGQVPHHWDQALDRFHHSSILKDYLGDQFCELYLHCKTQEMETINSQVTDVEFDRYFVQS